MSPNNLAGQTYGRLTVLGPAEHEPRFGPHPAWVCLCTCGQTKIVVAPSLRSGLTKSCGCIRRERTGAMRRSHQQSGSREYNSWAGAKQRCHNPKCEKYEAYGGRGIRMCVAWRSDFLAFLRDMGPCPPDCTIDRIDNSRGYEPGNCRWARIFVQANNTRANHVLTFRNESRTIAEWARILGIKSRTIHDRVVKLGWSVERALTTPVK